MNRFLSTTCLAALAMMLVLGAATPVDAQPRQRSGQPDRQGKPGTLTRANTSAARAASLRAERQAARIVARRQNDSAQHVVDSLIATRTLDIRVAWFQGTVALVDSLGAEPVAIGIAFDSSHVLKLGTNARAQVAVNGEMLSLAGPHVYRWRDVIRAATGKDNEEVSDALQYLAQFAPLTSGGSVDLERVRSAISTALGLPVFTRLVRTTSPETSDDKPVILEPRSTWVTRGPLRFRWLAPGDSATWHVAVFDKAGQEVFSGETRDTTLVWDGAQLFPESEYHWTLARTDDTARQATATFRRLDDIKGMRVEGGESRIRIELGSENPALPLLMAAHFARLGLHGDAARQFTTAALRNPEHYTRFMRLAREQYANDIGLNERELDRIAPPGATPLTVAQ